MSEPTVNISWQRLLHDAVNKPGLLSTAFRAFHNYSLGNQMLAIVQCGQRGITPGPIATFMGWKEKGRHVKKGEKALMLCMPITIKTRAKDEPERAGNDAQDAAPATFTAFTYKNNWFVLSQTEGADVAPQQFGGWDRAKALDALGITEIPFDSMNGNLHGFARKQAISINSAAPMVEATTFHEMAHIVLGHTSEAEQMSDSDRTPCDIRELEAESVAYLMVETLALPGGEYCRGYIQNWFMGHEVSEKSAQRIFSAADKILKAGRA